MKEITNILVPIDFSGNTDKVVETAKGMADKLDAQMHLLYVAEGLAPYTGFVIPHISTDILAEELYTYAEQKMSVLLEEQCGDKSGCSGHVTKGDDVAEQIVAYAKKNKADMIIMGTHGFKGIERTLMGSAAENVLRLAECPVMVVKPS